MNLPNTLSRKVIRFFTRWIYRGDRFHCPLCQSGYSRFLPMGSPPRPQARCPGCGSLERHRLLWTALQQLRERQQLIPGGHLLHVAPESCLGERLRGYQVVAIDRYAAGVSTRADVTALCFPDNCFDLILCNHVLEHVANDRQALSELFRVLKKGGWASIQVPMAGATTREDPAVTDPVERQRLYGQSDHVRQYGGDFRQRLQSAGFELVEICKAELLDPLAQKRLSVACEDSVLLVRKPVC